jgi:hypothetical protein
MKNNNKNSGPAANSNYVILILVIGLLILLIFNKDKKEGFQSRDESNVDKTKNNSLNKAESELLDNIKSQYKEKYPESSDDVLKRLASLELTQKSYGISPDTHQLDLSKYVLKSSVAPDKKEYKVEDAVDKAQYIHKNSIPHRPKLDLDKYVLKASIPPEKKCPPQKDIDYSKYVLKSSIPPVQKCPPCVCPKVKVSAGLCKTCPPPPKCPAPNRCPAPQSCPEMKPCPANKEKVLHEIKYIKVPTFIEKKVVVDENGNVIKEMVNGETVSGSSNGNNNNDNYNNSNSNNKNKNNSNSNNNYNNNNNNDNNNNNNSNHTSKNNTNWNNNTSNHQNNQNGWNDWGDSKNSTTNTVDGQSPVNNTNNSNLEQTQPQKTPRPDYRISRGGEARLNDNYFELNSDYSSKSSPISGHQNQLDF